MHKLFTITAILILLSFMSFSQAPTLTAAGVNPIIGEEYIIYNCDPTGVEPGPGTADTTWDFSGLHLLNSHTAVDTGYVLSPEYTEPYAIFAASNVAVSTPTASLLAYYIENDSVLAQNGLYTSTTQYTAYADPMDQLQFPFTFNNVFTDTYNGFVVYTPTGGPTVHATNIGSITATADAYGSLFLPGGRAFQNVLRVHSIQLYTDSVNLFGTPVVQSYTLETYAWYTQNYHNILMTIATATGPGVATKQVSYSKQINNTLAAAQNAPVAYSMALFPNPSNSVLNIAYNTTANEHVRVTLTDVLGRNIATITDGYTQGAQQLGYNTASLPDGLYMVRLQAGQKTITKQVEVQHK